MGYAPLSKAEFVVSMADDDAEHEFYIIREPDVRDRVVRCKDCRYYIDHAWVIYTDLEHICTFWNGGTGVKVEPDGFCKWGVAKDA